MKTSLRVRKFRSEDLDKVLEIEAQAFPKTVYPEEIFLAYARALPKGFIVAELEGDIAGYLIFDPNGHVHSTAVKSACRRRGLGRALFRHASSHAEKRLWLEVRSKNEEAIRFYQGLGMRVIGKVPGYYGSDDALLMVMAQGGRSAGEGPER